MQPSSRGVYRFDRFMLDAHRRQLRRDGDLVPLQAKPLDLLVALVESGGRPVSKDDLLEKVWPGQVVEESNLSVHMSALRKALGERSTERRFIVTEPGHGYRFVADLIPLEPESEPGHDQASVEALVLAAPSSPAGLRHVPLMDVLASVTLLAVILALTIYTLWGEAEIGPSPGQFTLSQLTRNGRVSGATLAPDGKYAAFVLAEPDGNSLWVQQVGTAGGIRILPPTRSQFWGLAFSPDGADIYYSLFSGNTPDIDLYRLPSLGGVPHKLPNISAPGFAISPDGRQIAHATSHAAVGKTFLKIVNIDGTESWQIAERQHPSNFEIRGQVVSWSPDGSSLAAVVNHYGRDSQSSSITRVSITDGAEGELSSARWYNVAGLQWLNDGSGVVLVASDHPSTPNQVWFLPYPSAMPRRITNDLSHYGWLGVAADGQSILTVQTNAISSVWLGQESGEPLEIISEIGPLSPFAWLSDRTMAFRSRAGGGSNLWSIDADGGDRRQLTTDAQGSERGMCTSPDGRHIVFVSWRAGNQNLWRLNVDDRSLTRLTAGDGEGYPSCSPDGRWVIYQSGLGIGKSTVWRIPLRGGPAEALTTSVGARPVVSNDGQRIAYFYLDADKWRVAIIPADGGPVVQTLDVPEAVTDRLMRWSPGDDALYYVATAGDVGNLWALPLDGSRAQPVTRFRSHVLEDFAFSASGRLAFARTTASRDVVRLSSDR